MKDTLRNLIVLGAAFAFCLILGELLLRLVVPQQLIIPNHHIWRPDAEIGWRHVENTNTEINTGEGTVRFVTDADGYRIDPRPKAETSTKYRILVIGDSFVEATSVEQPDAFPGVLQRLLDSAGWSSRVVNDGVGGWGPNQYLRETHIALSKGKYDLGVVSLYVGNDVATTRVHEFSPHVVSQRPGMRWPRELSWNECVDAMLYPVNDWLEQRSHLFVFLKNSLESLVARWGLTAAYFPDVFRISGSTSDGWDITSDIGRDIALTFRSHETPVLFVLLPTPYQVTRERFDEYLRMFDIDPDSVDLHQPNRLLVQAFAEDSLVLLDPLEFLRARSRPDLPLFGSVDGHFNEHGHAAVADFLLPHVIDSLSRPVPRDARPKGTGPAP